MFGSMRFTLIVFPPAGGSDDRAAGDCGGDGVVGVDACAWRGEERAAQLDVPGQLVDARHLHGRAERRNRIAEAQAVRVVALVARSPSRGVSVVTPPKNSALLKRALALTSKPL